MVFLIRGTKIIDPYLHMAIETVDTHDIAFLSLIFLVADSSLFKSKILSHDISVEELNYYLVKLVMLGVRNVLSLLELRSSWTNSFSGRSCDKIFSVKWLKYLPAPCPIFETLNF